MTDPKISTGVPAAGNGNRPPLPWETARSGGASASAASEAGVKEDAQSIHALQQVKGRVHRDRKSVV